MKFNRLLLIALSVFCIVSCDDFLTETPTTQLSEDTLFADEANLEASLVGVYNGLVTGGNGCYLREMLEFAMLPSKFTLQKDNRTQEDWTQSQMLTLLPNSKYNDNIPIFISLLPSVISL